MTLIIGIAGRARVGKDTFADYLQKYATSERKLNVNIYSFAVAVKQVIGDTFDISMEMIEKYKITDEPYPETHMTMRKMLQFVGDGFRKFKDTVWIEKVVRQIKEDAPDIAIISDVRYKNEADMIRKDGGVVVLVYREEVSNNDDHPSETAWLLQEEEYKNCQGFTKVNDGVIDYFVKNTTKEKYYSVIEDFLQSMKCIA